MPGLFCSGLAVRGNGTFSTIGSLLRRLLDPLGADRLRYRQLASRRLNVRILSIAHEREHMHWHEGHFDATVVDNRAEAQATLSPSIELARPTG